MRIDRTERASSGPFPPLREGPGYAFFFGQFNGTGDDVRRKALLLGSIVDRADRLQDAQLAYNFFAAQFKGNDNTVKFAAADAAVVWIDRGSGSIADLQQVFIYFLSQFDGTDNQSKAVAARCAAVGVGRGMTPNEIALAYLAAYHRVPDKRVSARLEAARVAVGDLD